MFLLATLAFYAGDLPVLDDDIGGLVDSRPGASLCVDCARLSTAASVIVTGGELDQRAVGLDRARRHFQGIAASDVAPSGDSASKSKAVVSRCLVTCNSCFR